MGMTKRRERQEKHAEDYIPILGLEYMLMGILREGTPPSVEKTREMDRLKEEIKAARKKLRPAAGQNALGRLQAEELMTKKFFRRFRNKHANTNILELHKTEDWDEPELGEATQIEEEIEKEATKYYQWLYKTKETDDQESNRLLNILRRNPIPAHIAREADTPIGEKHVTQAIRSAGTGKSPGPDGLPTEFYKHYEDLIVPLLTEVINHSYLEGTLPATMREGDVALIYKKKDPKDIRNYRPISLLNVDYKILARILAEKIKKVCEAAISNPQKGFVPGRQITDLIRQMYLIQDYVEELDEEGLIVLLDMEKAFDRCSWSFLKDSMEAIGVGPRMRRWVGMIYSEEAPPKSCLLYTSPSPRDRTRSRMPSSA